MARARLSKRLSDSDAISLFAQHHITQVRRRKNGEIVAVKHIGLGWIPPERFYLMQKADDMLPILEKFIEGGFRLKAALWGTTVGAGTIQIPVAALLTTGALGLSIADGGTSSPVGLLDILSLALPFGEIYLLLRGIDILSHEAEAVGNAIGGIPGLFSGDECEKIRSGIAELDFLLSNPFLIDRSDFESARSQLEARRSALNCPR